MKKDTACKQRGKEVCLPTSLFLFLLFCPYNVRFLCSVCGWRKTDHVKNRRPLFRFIIVHFGLEIPRTIYIWAFSFFCRVLRIEFRPIWPKFTLLRFGEQNAEISSPYFIFSRFVFSFPFSLFAPVPSLADPDHYDRLTYRGMVRALICSFFLFFLF